MNLIETGKDPQTGITHYRCDTDIQVLLVGSRGVGKTSLVASMIEQIDEWGLSGSFYPIGDTAANLTELRDQMKTSLEGKTGNFKGIAGIQKTDDISYFDMELLANYSRKGKQKRFCFPVRIVDLPGGWYTTMGTAQDVAERTKEVRRLLSQSTVSLLCVNTPSFMEDPAGEKKLFQWFNHPTKIAGWYNNDGYLQQLRDSGHKVVFVLSRCEKYRGKHEKLVECFKEYKPGYRGLIKGMENIGMPAELTYVHTLGGVEFDSFEGVNTSECRERYKVVGDYAPENCNVPLRLALEHACESIVESLQTANKRLVGKWKNMLGLSPNGLAEIALSDTLNQFKKEEMLEGQHYWSLSKMKKEEA
ncbi:MAG: hypothetical protein UHH87_03495 [Akkermansia sp.]|nr:hypothetical protein [Akkermansia sp.]